MSRILTAALFILTLAAPAMADTVPEGVKLRAYPPVGKGDPNAISCWAWRITPPIKGLRCARNSDWARMNASIGRLGRAGPNMEGPSGNVPAPPPPIRTQP
jgi:hypothetical protein